MAVAGVFGSMVGKNLGKIYSKAHTKCVRISKNSIYSTDEIMKRSINIAETTTLNLSQAVDRVEIEVNNPNQIQRP